jgi:hypothetical protein
MGGGGELGRIEGERSVRGSVEGRNGEGVREVKERERGGGGWESWGVGVSKMWKYGR